MTTSRRCSSRRATTHDHRCCSPKGRRAGDHEHRERLRVPGLLIPGQRRDPPCRPPFRAKSHAGRFIEMLRLESIMVSNEFGRYAPHNAVSASNVSERPAAASEDVSVETPQRVWMIVQTSSSGARRACRTLRRSQARRLHRDDDQVRVDDGLERHRQVHDERVEPVGEAGRRGVDAGDR